MSLQSNSKIASPMRAIWWGSVALLGYTVLGYPLLVAALARLRPRPVHKAERDLPTVSLIISAYNEEAAISRKLDNSFALDYPVDRLEVIVVSDCSADRTDELVREHPRYHAENWGSVRLVRQTVRGGKTAAQNAAVLHARGEILLFSDATSDYQPDVLQEIVPNFADNAVGCVAGRLVYVDPKETQVGGGARSYWGYETFIKTNESLFSSLIGVSGCMYAVRKSAYRPLDPEASSDFVIATEMVEQGLRAVLEPNAICFEETNKKASRELKMRVRIITQTYRDLWRMRAMLNPLRSGFYAVQLMSHKILRYAIPVFLLTNYLANWSLRKESGWARLALSLQNLVVGMAALSCLVERTPCKSHRVARILAMPRYFLLSNAAPLLALWQVMRGERYATWETQREPGQQPPGSENNN